MTGLRGRGRGMGDGGVIGYPLGWVLVVKLTI